MSIASSRGKPSRMPRFLSLLGVTALGLLVFLMPARDADAASRTRFWNLTTGTIKEFRLAPAGSASFGKNQCENDPDSGRRS